MMFRRSDRRNSWHHWENNQVWNVLVMIAFVLGGSLFFIPILEMILEDPSTRFPALVLGIGALSFIILIFTLPKRDWQQWLLPEMKEKRAGSTSAINSAANGSREGMIDSLIELRSILLRRIQKRRRLIDEELKHIVQSPAALQRILGDELLEELLLEDPRYMAWKMEQDGGFLDRYEELLIRAEAWR